MQEHAAESGTGVLEPPRSGPVAVRLVEKLETTRSDMRQFQRRRGLLQVGLVLLLLAGLLALADWMWVLSTLVRVAGLLGLGGVALFLAARAVLFHWQRFERQDAAAEVEAGFPDLGQRVRTTIEYVEPTPATMPASPGLVEALTTDTDRRTTSLDFRHLIPWGSLRLLQVGLAGLVVLIATALVASPELRIAAKRLLLLPVHYTRIEVTPGDHVLKVGGEFTVQTTLSGRPVTAAELYYRPAGSQEDWTKLSLAPPELAGTKSPKLSGTLETTLKDCQQDLDYRAVAGPVESPVYRLTILRPIVLKHIQAVVEPPAYTRWPTATLHEGNFQVIAGSKVRFRFTLDREPQTARLLLYSAAKKAADPTPLALQREGAVLAGELAAVKEEFEYEIVAEAADGMKLDAGRFRIRVQADRKPTVRFIKPREQIEVTPTTEVNMRIEAADDFGLSKLGIVYQIGNGPKKTLHLEVPSGQPTSVSLQKILALEDYPLTHQDSITYYAFAEDNRPDEPQRAMTDLQFIDIRPYKRAFQLLETGGS